MSKARIWLNGLGLAALSVGLVLVSRSAAGDDKAAKAGILKIAAAIEKGDAAAAKSQAQALAKKVEELEDIMNVFKPRNKGGLGVGAAPGKFQPDGIELMLNKIARDAPSQTMADKGDKAFAKMSHIFAAVAEVTRVKAPKSLKAGEKKDWARYVEEMSDGATKLTSAAKSKSPAEIQKAAAKVHAACNNCHSKFRQ